MGMTWRVAGLSCLFWTAGAVGAAVESRAAIQAGGLPGGGFPAEGVEFLLVSPGYGVCLSRGPGRAGAVGAGRPCEWEAPGAEQRWRYRAGRLVNVASGECLLASSLGPCDAAGEAEVRYELLAQRLVLLAPRTGAGCFVVDAPGWGATAGSEPDGPLVLGLAPLDSRECGAEHVASKWMLVPLLNP